MFIKTTALIIPTKDRLDYLKKFFISIKDYIEHFNEIIIVDSSSKKNHEEIIRYFFNYENVKVLKSEPSTSKQRNVGLKLYNKENHFLMFCDDDIIINEKALMNMDEFIKSNSLDIGYGFNLIEEKVSNFFENFKKNLLFEKIGFYHRSPGIVCENGWHTKIINVEKNCKTMWLSTQACVYRTKFLNNITFNEKLGKYSYLEDLFFSYQVSKNGTLSICHNSTYKHPINIERTNFNFGVKEIINRYNFVKVNKLNKVKFYITVLLKLFFNIANILRLNLKILPKLFGNIIGIFLCLIKY